VRTALNIEKGMALLQNERVPGVSPYGRLED